jgi:hypothetical protein
MAPATDPYLQPRESSTESHILFKIHFSTGLDSYPESPNFFFFFFFFFYSISPNKKPDNDDNKPNMPKHKLFES